MGGDFEAMSDDHLAVAYYAGDDLALDQLIRRHERSLGRVVLHTLPRQLDRRARAEWARDIVQAVWIKVMETKGKPSARWKPGRPFGPWLRTIAYNCTRDATRGWERRDKPLAPLPEEDAAGPASCDPEPGSDIHLDQLDLQRCIEKLPAADRWTLAESMEMDQKAIAQDLGKSEASVTRALARIRAWLRKCTDAARKSRNGGD